MVTLKRVMVMVALTALALGLCGGPYQAHRRKAFVTVGGFTANTAVFDGTNDYLTLSGVDLHTADTKLFTFSVWVRFDGGDAATQRIFSGWAGTTFKLLIFRSSTNVVRVIGRTTGTTAVLDVSSTSSLTTASGWTHLYICVDLANSSNRHIYFDGVDVTDTPTTYTDTAMDISGLASPAQYIGANNDGTSKLNGALAELWFLAGTYLDAPGSFASGGVPIDIGATGSTPTGGAPWVYLSRVGSGDTWAQDSSGNARNFTVTGALGTTTLP